MLSRIEVLIIAFTTIIIFQNCQDDKHVTVMSFNIRYNTLSDGRYAWTNRKENVVDLIKYYKPDILGLQEALNDQVQYLNQHLPEYDWVGVGRDDGKSSGEYSAVFINTKRFRLDNNDTFWLSETPHVPGSMGWDAACTRIVTWLLVKDVKTGQQMYVFNTHFDHLGDLARLKSAELLLTMVNKIAGLNNVIITGDFNASDTSAVYRILTGGSDKSNQLFIDARKLSQTGHNGPDWTYQGFDKEVTKKKLDYIFLQGKVRVYNHEYILNPSFGDYPSDHLPVFIEIEAMPE